jgi:hypothetical protein
MGLLLGRDRILEAATFVVAGFRPPSLVETDLEPAFERCPLRVLALMWVCEVPIHITYDKKGKKSRSRPSIASARWCFSGFSRKAHKVYRNMSCCPACFLSKSAYHNQPRGLRPMIPARWVCETRLPFHFANWSSQPPLLVTFASHRSKPFPFLSSLFNPDRDYRGADVGDPRGPAQRGLWGACRTPGAGTYALTNRQGVFDVILAPIRRFL